MDKWRKSSRLNKLHLLMVEDSFYGTRCIDNIIEFKRKNITRVATLSEKPDEAMDCVNQLFFGPSVPDNQHQFERVRPLDLQFDPLGYIIHLAVALDKTNLTKRLLELNTFIIAMVFTRKMPVSLIHLITNE